MKNQKRKVLYMTRLEELNKEFDLNIDEITIKENKKK